MSVVVSHLTKKYANQLAVDNLSFEAKPGEILGFLGPNGAGKSTTLKIITGFLEPTEGHVTVPAIFKARRMRHDVAHGDWTFKRVLDYEGGQISVYISIKIQLALLYSRGPVSGCSSPGMALVGLPAWLPEAPAQLANLAEAAQLVVACQGGESAGRPALVLAVALQAAWTPRIPA